MKNISIKNLTIDFPIFGLKSRSLKTKLIQSISGGSILSNNDTLTIRALENISLNFNEGDRVALVGHNGSGKSTLLRAIAGIYEPTNGTIKVEGNIVTLLDIFLGMDEDATGYENIIARGLVMGKTVSEMKGLVDDIVNFSGIGSFVNMPMRTYSSGMAIRLAFATSTCFDADIVLMDEWLSVGDSDFQIKSIDRLNKFIEKAKIVIVASHDEGFIKKFSNKKIHLDHGKLIK
jgi:ABC-type polysaccharide/polyol phosphate transport system ATPase subunit